ncbi:metallophosphoesterase family protein [bacterium]|nr:metallophosphoesterase family protein [bacterium]
MRLVAVADVHDRFDQAADTVRRLAPVDVLIVAGDITTNGTPADVERACALWRPLATHLFAVAGNMDSPAIDDTLVRLGVSLDGHAHRVDDLVFYGCSAAPVAIGTPYEIPEEDLAGRIRRGWAAAAPGPRQVFIPHAPPQGAVDRTTTGIDAGSRAVRRFIDEQQPALVICGHIHEARGQVRLGQSLVVNCGAAAHGHYALIETKGGKFQVSLG